jgi:hypothetical protein
MQQFIVGVKNANIIVGQRRLPQQTMREMDPVDAAADNQQREHYRSL